MATARYIICFLAGCLIGLPPCIPQKFQAINDEVPMALTTDLFQDSYGFMWFGTNNGLVKFDGYSARRHYHDPQDSLSLSTNYITAIYEDSKRRMFIGYSEHGVDIFDRDLEEFMPVGGDVQFNDDEKISVLAILEDYQGRYWYGTTHGLISVLDKGDTTIAKGYHYSPLDSASISSDRIYLIYEDRHHNLWIGTRNGINLFDNGQFSNHRTNSTFPSTPILDITEDQNGRLWTSMRFTEHRMAFWDDETGTFVPSEKFVGKGWGDLRLAFDDDDVWISSRGRGAFRYHLPTERLTHYNPYNAQFHGFRGFYSLFNLVDKYGNVWFAGGVIHKWPASNKAISSISSEGFPSISIYADDKYIWYFARAPVRWDRNTYSIEEYLPEQYPANLRLDRDAPFPTGARIYMMADLDNDHLVFTSTRNIYILDKRTDKVREYATGFGGPFRDFAFGKDGIWICGNQGSPIHFDWSTRTASRHDFSSEIQAPDVVTKSASGTLWFGSSVSGVYSLDENTRTVRHFGHSPEDPERSFTSTRVHDVYAQTDSVIWIATDLGLNKLYPTTGKVDKYRLEQGLPTEYISSILQEQNGTLWLGTGDGIVRFDPASESITHYTREDGLINHIYTHRACYMDEDGAMYFAGDKGVDFFHPAEMGINSVPPDLYISKISIANTPLQTGLAPENLKSVTIGYYDNFLEIELLGLHLTAPSGNQYAYRIKKIKDEWIQLGTRRTISLTHLRPGHYTVEARASNADGIWSEDKTLLQLTVKPPFWQTWWFYTICIVAAVCMIYGVYRYRVAQIRKQEQLKTEFNKIIAEIEMKALRAQMNPHFLFNSLNSVKSLISQGESDKATDYLTRFGQLIRQVLNNSRKKLVRLQEDLEALRLYLDLEKMRFQNFEYSINVDPDVNADFLEIPPLLLQPYVENAIWHGLMHKLDGDKKVSIEISKNGEMIKMSVTDNGIGRERAMQNQTRSSSKKGGLGMKISGDRLRLLHEIYGKEAHVEIEDLEHPSGTRVTVFLPNPD